MAALSYIPPPEEMGYYKALFQAADVQQTNNIGGAQAVSFFARSKLPMEVLKNIWTVADQPSTSSLDIKKFAVAVRLIQLTQNGQKGQGPNLAAPPGVQLRPPVFEGVSGVSVPLPQTGGQPPQQQQQAPPPTPTRAMRPQQSAPPTPRQGLPPQSPTRTSRALTQDPYSLTPHERGRYESLFPQYAKDGYVYGKEAVELFSKSGVNQAVLRDIWNMVDSPVDNRLDKLEFALAMHLIVCISKKNLPIPPNGLPYSLKLLKQEQQPPQTPVAPTPTPEAGPPGQSYNQPPPQAQPGAPPQMVHPPAEAPMPTSGYGGMPSPAPQMRGPSPAMNGHPHGNMAIPSDVSSFDQQSTGMPPPVVSTGGMNISDAFEGLSTNSPDVPSSLPAYVPEPPPVASQPEVQYVPPPVEQPPVERKPAPEPIPDVSEPPKSTKSLASSYDMGDASEELVKLKGVLQKLQAENISLKAQLGSMSEEEKSVQKELSATVAEIGKLSNELTTLRAEVIAAKSKLMEASAELKAAEEKKGVISDLINEAQDTKDAVVEATNAIEKAKENLQSAPPVDNRPRGDMFESNLFGYDAAPTPAPNASNATPYNPAHGSEPTTAAPDSFVNDARLPDPAPQFSNVAHTATAAPELPQVTTVDSSDIDSAPATSTDQTESYVQAPVVQTPMEPPIQMFGEASHRRRDSNPFASDFVMGGAPVPLQPPTETMAPAPSSVAQAAGHGYGEVHPSERHNVEELKTKAALAEETARDAAAAHRKLMAETDELRRDADKAEAHARTLKAQADEKKKGRFGGGKQKKMLREADKASADAADIRKRFLAVQAQANDAQAVVMETKREVEKLRNEAEQAELDAVQMASLRERQQAQQKAEQEAQAQQSMPPAPPQPAPASNGYPGHGGPPAYTYGKEQMPPPAMAPGANGAPYGGGYGQAPPSLDPSQNAYGGFPSYGQEGAGGFGAGVMGGGDNRFDLPSPDQVPQGESYANPFPT